ncbi:MAG: polyprenyl diphosphate synthase [Candidatus Andersenbacteria bacterium]
MSTATPGVPKHVGIIMDGNRRWARQRGLDPLKGHEAGVETIRAIMRKAQQMGVTNLTLYAFSTENFHRTKREVAGLFRLMLRAVVDDRLEILKNRVRFRTIGDVARLPRNLRVALRELARVSERNNRFILNLAIDYGGRSEIVRAVRRLLRGGIRDEEVTEDAIAGHLDTAGQDDPDLIIRTGGEQRLSNFLLWQSSYSELYFSKRLWPEFSEGDFEAAVTEYQQRQRRFGH